MPVTCLEEQEGVGMSRNIPTVQVPITLLIKLFPNQKKQQQQVSDRAESWDQTYSNIQ